MFKYFLFTRTSKIDYSCFELDLLITSTYLIQNHIILIKLAFDSLSPILYTYSVYINRPINLYILLLR